MITKTKGIVINEVNYGETSKILTVLTEDYGSIGIMAKGARTMKSKLRGVSQKLVYGEFSINKKDKGLSSLHEVSVVNSFKNIFNDINKAGYAFYIIDLLKQVLKDNNDPNIFHILESALIKINDDINPHFITDIVEIKMLKYLGVSLELEKCVICGKHDNFRTISIEYGGLICCDCYKDGYIFDSKTIKLIRIMYFVDIMKIDKVTITDDKVMRELDDFIREYYTQYTGIYLKNKDAIGKWLI